MSAALGRASGVLTVALSFCGACAKRSPPGESAVTSPSIAPLDPFAPQDGEPLSQDAGELAAWWAAGQGDDDDRIRLADDVGCDGLREAAASPQLRVTALRAMAYCRDFSELSWLAKVAAVPGRDQEPVARLALDAIVQQAARPRASTDPEDAEELADGCRTLLALARSGAQPRDRRVCAVRALRLLADRGCVKRSDIPSDFDAK